MGPQLNINYTPLQKFRVISIRKLCNCTRVKARTITKFTHANYTEIFVL